MFRVMAEADSIRLTANTFNQIVAEASTPPMANTSNRTVVADFIRQRVSTSSQIAVEVSILQMASIFNRMDAGDFTPPMANTFNQIVAEVSIFRSRNSKTYFDKNRQNYGCKREISQPFSDFSYANLS